MVKLRLFPDYGGDSPVWSSAGRVPLDELRISVELVVALRAWQRENEESGGSEEEYEAEGHRLAEWLERETGVNVVLDL
jgi:predicted dienelactone hydrolase